MKHLIIIYPRIRVTCSDIIDGINRNLKANHNLSKISISSMQHLKNQKAYIKIINAQ